MFAVALAVLALSAPPAGFVEAPRLEPAASYVAGKPVRVECAQTDDDWKRFLSSNREVGDPNGVAMIPDATMYLSAVACENLRGWFRGTRFFRGFGPSLLVLVHEAIHLGTGSLDEGVVDCDASHRTPRVAVRYFHVRPGKQLRAVMAAVAAYRAKESPEYRTAC